MSQDKTKLPVAMGNENKPIADNENKTELQAIAIGLGLPAHASQVDIIAEIEKLNLNDKPVGKLGNTDKATYQDKARAFFGQSLDNTCYIAADGSVFASKQKRDAEQHTKQKNLPLFTYYRDASNPNK